MQWVKCEFIFLSWNNIVVIVIILFLIRLNRFRETFSQVSLKNFVCFCCPIRNNTLIQIIKKWGKWWWKIFFLLFADTKGNPKSVKWTDILSFCFYCGHLFLWMSHPGRVEWSWWLWKKSCSWNMFWKEDQRICSWNP